MTLTRKVRIKAVILTVSIPFKLRTSIFTVSITVTLTAHALSVTFIMSVYISSSVFLEFEGLNELTDCDSISREVNKSSEISDNVLIDKDQLILDTLNID